MKKSKKSIENILGIIFSRNVCYENYDIHHMKKKQIAKRQTALYEFMNKWKKYSILTELMIHIL